MEDIVKQNNERVRCLFLMFIIHPLNNFLFALCDYLEISAPNIMIMLYLIVLAYGMTIALKHSFTKGDLGILCFIYFIYLVLYWISIDSAKEEMLSVYMKIVYSYFIPLSVLLLSKISMYSCLFKKRYIIICDIIVIASIIEKVMLNDQVDCMIFSYDLLPIWGIIIISALYFRNKIQWLFVGAILIEAIVFGSRGPIIWMILCGTLVSLVDFLNKNTPEKYLKAFLTIPLIGIALSILITEIIPRLLKSKFASSSYILVRMSMGSLSESNARKELYQICYDTIGKMGLNVYGFYYDRSILPNGLYAHNIFIESLLTFGWFFGIIFLVFIISIIVKSFFRQSVDGKIFCIYFISVLFLRYFLSGSIFGEGKFIMFLAIMISLCKYKQNIEMEGENDDYIRNKR